MARVTIAGNALIVTSALSLEDLKTVKKYRPDALILKGGEDGKEPIFGISLCDSEINSCSVSFCEETRDQAKLATLTTAINYAGEDIADYVSDKYGAAITNLNKLEETLPAVLAEIAANKEAIKRNITVIQ